jgi:hypothetical protein
MSLSSPALPRIETSRATAMLALGLTREGVRSLGWRPCAQPTQTLRVEEPLEEQIALMLQQEICAGEQEHGERDNKQLIIFKEQIRFPRATNHPMTPALRYHCPHSFAVPEAQPRLVSGYVLEPNL